MGRGWSLLRARRDLICQDNEKTLFGGSVIRTREQTKQFERILTALRRLDPGVFEGTDGQQIKVNIPVWDGYLTRTGRMGLRSVLKAAPAVVETASITRRDVVKLAQTTTTRRDREALLIATLVWGKGKGNNRMLPAFVRLLQNSKLDRALATSAEFAREGHPSAAYRAWRSSGVTGLGEAFFTKWLWAASHIGKNRFSADRPRCLVLDTRVWNTLGNSTHVWSSRVAADTRSRPARYAAYTRDCHDWATNLRVTAEQVEWAFFTANGRIDPATFNR